MIFISEHILTFAIFLPIIGALIVTCIPARFKSEIRILSLAVSVVTLILAIAMFSSFGGSESFGFEEALPWIPQLGIFYRIGIDGVSLLLILLTAILVPISIGCSWNAISKKVKSFHILVLVIETGLIGTFAALDAFLFYVFWELVLIPMYFIIGIWGSGNRIYSAIKFVIFTVFGSLMMLVGMLYCSSVAGGTFDLISWYSHTFGLQEQIFLFLAFAIAFAIKLPIVPLHTWLPDAHTDAPTAGSILLAGVLLKMGGYGFYRFAIPLFPDATLYFTPYFITLAVVGIIYGGLLALSQDDIKRLISYSSISHMGFVLLGLFSLNLNASYGLAIQMFAHGIAVGALFMMTGFFAERTKTLKISDYGGMARPMPTAATFFIFFALASAGLPGLSTFVGEFFILLGSFQTHTYFSAVAVLGLIIVAVYMLWLVQRLFFGKASNQLEQNPLDLNVREYLLVIPLTLIIIAVGIWPKPWISKIDLSSQNYIALSKRTLFIKEEPEIERKTRTPEAVESIPVEVEEESEEQVPIEEDTQEIAPVSTDPLDNIKPIGEEVRESTYEIEVKTKSSNTGLAPADSSEQPQQKKVTLPPLPEGLYDEDY